MARKVLKMPPWVSANLLTLGSREPHSRPLPACREGSKDPIQCHQPRAGRGLLRLACACVLIFPAFAGAEEWLATSDYARMDYAVGISPAGLIAEDFDDDGLPELVTADSNDSSVTLLHNEGGRFSSALTIKVGREPWALASGDFDLDGGMDLALTNWADNNVQILFNDGGGRLGPRTTLIPVDLGPESLFPADLDGDNDLDLVVANFGPLTSAKRGLGRGDGWNVNVLHNRGDGSFFEAGLYDVGGQPHTIVAADLTGDGLPEFATANGRTDDITLWRNDGEGLYRAREDLFAGAAPWALTAADFDLDGDRDLAVAVSRSHFVALFANDGDGKLERVATYRVGLLPFWVVAADLDGDGDPDLVTANERSDDISLLENLGDGTFGPQVTLPAGNGPYTVVAADLDGDGFTDLAVSNAGSNDVSVLLRTPADDEPPITGPAPPTRFTLGQNRPNPFNAVTAIPFALPEPGAVTLTVYDPTGAKIRDLARDRLFGAGLHTLVWNGKDGAGNRAASERYLYELRTGGVRLRRLMIFAK